MTSNVIKEITKEILEYVDEKPVLLGNSILLDWAERLQAISSDKMTLDDLIDQFIEDLDFKVLIIWADILGVEHDEDMWLDDMWPDAENELRVQVGDAMRKVGEK